MIWFDFCLCSTESNSTQNNEFESNSQADSREKVASPAPNQAGSQAISRPTSRAYLALGFPTGPPSAPRLWPA